MTKECDLFNYIIEKKVNPTIVWISANLICQNINAYIE